MFDTDTFVNYVKKQDGFVENENSNESTDQNKTERIEGWNSNQLNFDKNAKNGPGLTQ